MPPVTIYHNPKCRTSRNTLSLIRNAGIEPTVVFYLETPPSHSELVQLITDIAAPVRAVLRRKGTPYDELNLDDESWTDEALIDVMLKHPILINSPIVVTPWGTKLCRPSEAVLDVLPVPQLAAFTKEDGEQVIDTNGQRVVAQ